MRITSYFIGLLLLGCEACHHHTDANTPPEPPGSETCTVPGVEGAQRVDPLTLPRGCTFTQHGSFEAPRIVRTAEELAAALRCEDVPAPDIDLATHDVYIVGYTLSPASVGTETLDDGTTITFISRSRHNCPDDPMPTPMNVTFGFLMPKDATRALRSASCTLPEDC